MKNNARLWSSPFASSLAPAESVRLPEMLIGYLIGPFGAMLASGIFTSMLQSYFTDVLKLDLGFLTALQLISTVLIVASNLVVGQLIERTHLLAGKARPWILLSALLMSAASLLMFVVPFRTPSGKMVWIAIAYNLYYAVAYPIYNTANAALVPLSTRDSSKRSALASLVNMAGLATMGCGSMIFPVLVSFALKEDPYRWFLAMLAVAVFTGLTVYLQFRFTRERVTEELAAGEKEQHHAQPAPSIRIQLKAVASEKRWWIIIVFYLLFQWCGAIKNGSMVYFCKWDLANSTPDAWGAAQSFLAIAGAVPMVIAAAFVVPLANRFTKRLVVFAGLVVGVLGGVIAALGGSRVIPVASGVAIKCLGSAPAAYLILAMLADVIDHIEYKTGLRTDGLTMSIYSSIMVAATPVCNAIFSALLKLSGYNASADLSLGLAAQTEAVRGMIRVSYIWTETVAFALCAVLILFLKAEKTPQPHPDMPA